jgi:hypothetical protein
MTDKECKKCRFKNKCNKTDSDCNMFYPNQESDSK